MNLVRISIGCFLAIPLMLGIRNELLVYHSQTWPGIEGEIVKSELDSDGEGAISTHIVYIYTPKDEYFLGRRISFGYCGTGDVSDALNIVAQYPKGSKVTVYYDPNEFGLCTLQRERGVGGYLLIFAGCGLITGWLFLSRNRSPVSACIEADFDLSGDPDAAIKQRANDGDL